MATQESAMLAAHINDLDRETARRVARLVLECNASVALALRAVQAANQNAQRSASKRLSARSRFARMLAYFGSTREDSCV